MYSNLEKKDDYVDCPEQFFADINKKFEDNVGFLSLGFARMLFRHLLGRFRTSLQKLFVSLHTSEVLPGYLVSARCMVQNTLPPGSIWHFYLAITCCVPITVSEYFPLTCTVSDGAEKMETTGCLRDHFGEHITDIVDHGNHGCRNCYKMIMVPGAADWWIDEFNQTHTTALCRRDEGTVICEVFVWSFLWAAGNFLRTILVEFVKLSSVA
ncbi:hypothetical protein ANCDUO_15808 [Ancylostoma duodenale]|uniref:Uncharacterized protein n=1 Tax=Ancylostoma duodenale TaxID=51022 RepID=A0A0C2CW00_9BILA|nr:hypothetical protein ANCDUO_15808 [Ancylostoma duodenale]